MKYYNSHGNPVGLGECVGYGGEASVFLVLNRPHWLAKIYKTNPRRGYQQKLAWMVAHPPHNPAKIYNHPSLAWPVDLLFSSPGRLAGYLMPYIRVAVPILEIFNPKRRLDILPHFNRQHLHRVARNLAAALGALHQANYVAGDLNESNVLVTNKALVTLIDTDSYQVEEKSNGQTVLYPCPVGKFEYTPPELQGRSLGDIRRLPEHDAFGLGVLIFQLLMDGNHPFRSQWLGDGEPPPIEKKITMGGFPYTASPPCPVRPPKNAPSLNTLHPALAELIRRCFVDGHRNPSQRPTPAAWEKAITEAEQALIPCSQGHLYSNHLRRCPTCQAIQAFPSTPKPVHPEPEPAPLQTTGSSPRIRSSPPPAPAATSAASKPTSFPSLPKISFAQPAYRKGDWWRQLRPVFSRSLREGGLFGGAAGASLGALLGYVGWMAGTLLNSTLVWALGGAIASVARGWKPWQALGLRVNRRIGWEKYWQAAGPALGVTAFALLGLTFELTIQTLVIGLLFGTALGVILGKQLWQAARRFGWETIWNWSGVLGVALFGWVLALWLRFSEWGILANQLAGSLANWIANTSGSPALAYLSSGALIGAMGGVTAGIFTDLLARLIRLVK